MKSLAVVAVTIVVLAVAFSRFSSAEPTATRWEYTYLVVETERFSYVDLDEPIPPIDPTKDALLTPLAKAAADGWELVSITDDLARRSPGGERSTGIKVGYLYFMRRAKK